MAWSSGGEEVTPCKHPPLEDSQRGQWDRRMTGLWKQVFKKGRETGWGKGGIGGLLCYLMDNSDFFVNFEQCDSINHRVTVVLFRVLPILSADRQGQPRKTWPQSPGDFCFPERWAEWECQSCAIWIRGPRAQRTDPQHMLGSSP